MKEEKVRKFIIKSKLHRTGGRCNNCGIFHGDVHPITKTMQTMHNVYQCTICYHSGHKLQKVYKKGRK